MKWMLLVLLSFEVSAAELQVAFYNVENLFDTNHDADKNDWQFLPLGHPLKEKGCNAITKKRYRDECLATDWNETLRDLKLNQIRKGLKANFGDQLPDILGLSEIENSNITGQLAKLLGYDRFEISKGPDNRGIEVALLFRSGTDLKFSFTHEIVAEVKGSSLKKPTRNILEVVFELSGKPISFYVNHWPSQGQRGPARMYLAQILKSHIDQRIKDNPEHVHVVMGDFNSVASDFPHPFLNVMFVGTNPLDFAYSFLRGNKELPENFVYSLPGGTYFIPPKMNWNMLDGFFVTKNLTDKKGIELDTSSLRIHTKGLTHDFVYNEKTRYSATNYYYGTTIKGVPKKYDFSVTNEVEQGFSDHFPVSIKLKY